MHRLSSLIKAGVPLLLLLKTFEIRLWLKFAVINLALYKKDIERKQTVEQIETHPFFYKGRKNNWAEAVTEAAVNIHYLLSTVGYSHTLILILGQFKRTEQNAQKYYLVLLAVRRKYHHGLNTCHS